MKNIILAILFTATCFATKTNNFLKAKICLKTGKKFVCDVVEYKNRKLVVKRKLSVGMVATEYYDFDKIARLDFPKPAFLTNDLKLITPKNLNSTKKIAKEEFNKYKPFERFNGNIWLAQIEFELAKIYEKLEFYPSALKHYNRIARDKSNPEMSRFALLRKAVCSYKKGIISNNLSVFEKALDVAENDDEIAELNYYIGKIKSELGDPVAGNFMLLKNVIFYSSESDWEPKSLKAALENYATLDRKPEFVTTCNNLIRRFPKTEFSEFATNCLIKINSGVVLTNIFK